jgi:radical SAM superfamily enzyme YgiQ (UPF0313 family)
MEFEQGPIRPPSEARSLLVRVSRNCPWNRCTFCPVYKRRKFGRRELEEVLADLDAMARCADRVRERSFELGFAGSVNAEVASSIFDDPRETDGTRTLALWLHRGGTTVFLQDANALLNRQELLLAVLRRIRTLFPQVTRITSYGRAHTLATRPVEALAELRDAGLTRVHVGLETGSDEVLALVRKGATAAQCLEAGRRVRAAGLHLCFYVMPGLGGRALSDAHADDTARLVREVNPDKVRLRSLVVHSRTPMAEQVERGELEPLGDEAMAAEIGRFLEGLEGCTGDLVSDHDLNLLPEIEGNLAADREGLLGVVRRFQALSARDRTLYIVGRRTGLMSALDHLDDGLRSLRASALLDALLDRSGGDLDGAILALRERLV